MTNQRATMTAAVLTGLGGPEVLAVEEVARPTLEEGTTVVRVAAAGVNWLDVLMRREDFGLQFPHVPGSDVVGLIDELDGGSLSVGERVVLNPGICVTEADRAHVRILGLHSPGGYGQYVGVPSSQVFKCPAHLTLEEAAAVPLTYLTAWRMLSTRAKIEAGEVVFVWGASGGLGAAAVQLAKALGAVVVAGSGSEVFVDALRSLGADEVVLYKTENVVERVKAITAGRGADVVFETVGRETWSRSLAMLAPHGRVVISGTTSGGNATNDLTDIYYEQLTILGSRMGYPEEFSQVLALISTTGLRPAIAAVYELSDVRAAHEEIEHRRSVGKIVLRHSPA